MNEAKIICFFDRGGLIAALCTGIAGSRMRLLCPDGSEIALSESRAVHAAPCPADLAAPRERLTGFLHADAALREELARGIDAAALWKSGSPGAIRQVADLARAAFGESAGPVHERAVISALVADHVYFKLQGRAFLALSAEQAEINHRKKLQQLERQRFVSRSTVWLQAALAGKEVSVGDAGECIGLLKDYAALGKEAPNWSESREILHAGGLRDPRRCFDLLVKLGVFDPHENLLLRRHGISHEWPPEVLRQVEAIGPGSICAAVNDPGRQDLTGQYACAIDEAFTRDVDDAISFRCAGQDLELGVHITDVSAFVPAATPLDAEAARRGKSLYFPEAKIPMLPPALSESIASFRVGERSPALSFIARISPDGDMLDYCIVRSVVRIAERLTYGEVDEAIAGGSAMARLHGFALALRKKRLCAGGISFLIPELQVRVDRSSDITLKLRDRETPGQLLVAECMILANHCAARYFEESRRPALFRRQAESARVLTEGGSLYDMFLQRRMLRRVDISTAPGPHASLGLRCYASITSPLRKHLDLVMQRQLTSLLKGGPAAYGRRDLHGITESLQPVLARASLVENERWRYWVLTAVQQQAADRLDALVLDKNHGWYDVLLTRYMLIVQVREQDTGPLVPGSTLTMKVEEIDPFAGTIRLRVVK